MSAVLDGMALGGSIVSAVFADLDAVTFDGISLLDFLLAMMALVLTLEFVFWMFDVDINLWDYVFDSDEED